MNRTIVKTYKNVRGWLWERPTPMSSQNCKRVDKAITSFTNVFMPDKLFKRINKFFS